MKKEDNFLNLFTKRDQSDDDCIEFLTHLSKTFRSGDELPNKIKEELASIFSKTADHLKFENPREAKKEITIGFGVRERIPKNKRKPRKSPKQDLVEKFVSLVLDRPIKELSGNQIANLIKQIFGEQITRSWIVKIRQKSDIFTKAEQRRKKAVEIGGIILEHLRKK